MKNKVVICVDNNYYYGEFTNDELNYINMFSCYDYFKRRDVLIELREKDFIAPVKFISKEFLILNPFFNVWENILIDDYCLEKEDEHTWFVEIEEYKMNTLKNCIKINLTKE